MEPEHQVDYLKDMIGILLIIIFGLSLMLTISVMSNTRDDSDTVLVINGDTNTTHICKEVTNE